MFLSLLSHFVYSFQVDCYQIISTFSRLSCKDNAFEYDVKLVINKLVC